MAEYRISGVWKNSESLITHYAFHTVITTGVTRAKKITKSDAIKLLEIKGNTAKTWIWNYTRMNWENGENVEVVNSPDGKYLRSNPNDQTRDNLRHLINFDWLEGV